MGETTEAAMARAPPPSKPVAHHNHPPYAEMIFSAIRTLNDKKGSSRKAIAKFIGAAYLDLPPSHSALLTLHLRRLKQKGRLVMVRHSYKLPKQVKGPKSVEKRGRGRPPKPKPLGAAVAGAAVAKRGRGRPPKPKSLGAPEAKRPRGRPPKASGPAAVAGLGKKPRGRPRKVEKLGGGAGAVKAAKKRGRPAKKLKMEGGGGATSTGRPRGRPRKVDGGEVKKEGTRRPVGRPRKIVS